ncbi:MAG: chromosome segregation protein SMC [Burkholderiales bacterium]
MHLIAIKLAGFKSFVDPTHIPLSGQMVGIVGPNGCGKSNVIDAVRWVLGESQARQLRGASMADVIFNGSAKRKPVARASVELSFDNSDGKAPGPWAAYAEISVKRVLTRQGESVYYINNTPVRRRDLVDIFLGTGLGAKTPYAIIEQGMISRIIEARPDELRGFLEEAAGISKYKERRRETETRLNSTRDNLARLDDIRQVLDGQIIRLREQAQVAQTYLRLQEELKSTQQVLWFIKKRDALDKCRQLDDQIRDAGRQLEAKGDGLRAAEFAILAARGAQTDANALLHEAQGGFYAAGAEVSRLEQTVRHLAETRLRLQTQIEQNERQRSLIEEQSAAQQTDLAQRQQRAHDTRSRLEDSAQELAVLAADLQRTEDRLQETRRQVADRQRELQQAERSAEVGSTQLRHVTKALQQLLDRQSRLQVELESLENDDSGDMEQYDTKLAGAGALLDETNAQLVSTQEELHDLQNRRQQLRSELERCSQIAHKAEGELAALIKVQRQMTVDANTDAWLKQHKLESLPRFWQQIEVKAGWEKATEIALGDHLQALTVETGFFGGKSIAASGAEFVELGTSANEFEACELPRLLDQVTVKAGGSGALQDWLQHCYTAGDVAQAEKTRSGLPAGGRIFTPEGFVFTRYSCNYAKKTSATAGLLARQKDIESLTERVAQSVMQKTDLAEQLTRLEAAVGIAEQNLNAQRRQQSQIQQQLHQWQLEQTTSLQTRQRVQQRRERIAAELAEIAVLRDSEQKESESANSQMQQSQQSVARLKPALENIRRERQTLENESGRHREQHRVLERKRQEMQFSIELESSKINDITNNIKVSNEKYEQLLQQHAATLTELAALGDDTHSAALAIAIEQRQQAERALANARQRSEESGTALRVQEETRMTLEQSMGPLRDRLEDLRLKRQEADLQGQQCNEQLLALNADQDALSGQLAAGVKTTGLAQEIERLTQASAALGAVNLAAVQELEQSLERAGYLQAQAEDLEQAIATLSAVMTSIDDETRDLFKTTFDTVNQAMAELFATLFDGGVAQLSLTGEEWLDAGVQVFAQPPGKKNSSIHLLSGGEKALTALSLVFALFKLNPAPFCILDEVDAPLDDSNTERYIRLVKHMSDQVQFIFITHNRITMEAAEQLIGVTMPESGVSRTVSVDLEQAAKLAEPATAAPAET